MKKKAKKTNRNNHTVFIPSLKVDLNDIINQFKSKVRIGDGLCVYTHSASKDAYTYYCGYAVGIYEHFVLCKAASDNYNFTVSWKDLALGTAEVIL